MRRAELAGVAYVLLWSTQVIASKVFATAVQGRRTDVFAAVFLTELFKLCWTLCSGIPLRSAHGVLRRELASGDGLKLLLTAGIYTLYNILAYLNLSYVPVATYKVILASRVVFALALDACFVARPAAARLVGGACCVLSSLVVSPLTVDGAAALAAVAFQGFLSSAAGALTQSVVQRGSLTERNFALYVFTTSTSLFVVAARFNAFDDVADTLASLRNPSLFASLCITAVAGLVTSVLLREAGNVVKTMLSGFELFFVSLASFFLFTDPLTWRAPVAVLLTAAGYACDQHGGAWCFSARRAAQAPPPPPKRDSDAAHDVITISTATTAASAPRGMRFYCSYGVIAVALLFSLLQLGTDLVAQRAAASPRARSSDDVWRDVWNRKGTINATQPLHVINGFDHLSDADYDMLIGSVLRRSGIPFDNISTVLDVGCGAGAFIHFLQRTWPHLVITGVDYSAPGRTARARRSRRWHTRACIARASCSATCPRFSAWMPPRGSCT
jgi:hypothetical protein